jgi:MarR family transcriptional regulator, organic hydroperoxide resistance regulator
MSPDLSVLFHDLVLLEIDLWNRADARLSADHGLSMAWVEVMTIIRDTPDCRVIDIARSVSITVGGASKIVDKIERAGLIRRRRNPNDGRSHILELTASGRRRLAAARSSLADQLDRDLGSAATPEQMQEFAYMLAHLRGALPPIDHDDAVAQG